LLRSFFGSRVLLRLGKGAAAPHSRLNANQAEPVRQILSRSIKKKRRNVKMLVHGKDIKIFCGNSTPEVASQIARQLGTEVGKSNVGTFSDGEISVSIKETVRGSDVFVIQSTCDPVNNNLMELLIMIDAFKRASAARITAVIPYFGYARQDRKAHARDPISAKLVADLITAAGANRVLTMDLHAPQIQGFSISPLIICWGYRF